MKNADRGKKKETTKRGLKKGRNSKLTAVHTLIKNCPKAPVDGEVVVFNEEGMPDFDALQKYNGLNTPIAYCLFDILWLDGKDLTHLPLTERKEILALLTVNNPILQLSASFEGGTGLYKEMLDRNLEGIVAKRKDSFHVPGERADNWLKTPTRKRQEFVIGGWAESDKSRSFRSLLFGAYNNGKLEWIGRSGGGYKDSEMPGILKKLQAIEIDEIRKPATFLGFRKDKKAIDVIREVPKTAALVENEID